MGLLVNIVTANKETQQKYFEKVTGNEELIENIFDMCWGEYDCNPDIDTTPLGEKAMASFLIFIYNCTFGNADLLTKYIKDQDGAGLLYRVHRYNYISEKYA